MEQNDLFDYKIVGARIKEIRIKAKMSQAELAEASNISLPHISNIERGKSSMMLSTFISISKALNVTADSLLQPVYNTDLNSVLDQCNKSELEAILRIITELLKAISLKHKSDK